MKILITGGTGLIGSKLGKELKEKGHEVRVLTRKKNVQHPFYSWDNKYIDNKAFDDLDGIIHLSGSSISKRWTDDYKKEINDSRVNSAELLYKYVKKNKLNIKFFISASATGYYGQITSDKIFNEDDTSFDDFLGKVCKNWENAAYKFKDFGSRVVCVRTPLVLTDIKGGAFELMKKPIQIGIGSNLGDGKQWVPWIHLEDLIDIYVLSVENDGMDGSYNAVVPEMINNSTFNKILAKRMGKKLFMPNIPPFLLRMILGEMSVLVLKGSRISSKKIEDLGFKFSYPNLNKALDSLL